MSKLATYVATIVLCCAPGLSSYAHETGIYESLEHIPIGRVFLSPTERQNLDKNRGATSPLADLRATSAGKQSADRDDRAAGYIVSGSGNTRVWRDGDFVPVNTPSAVRFPGEVKVTREADTVPNVTDDEFESSDAGAEDDAQ